MPGTSRTREEARLLKDQNDEIRILKENAYDKLRKLLDRKEVAARLVDDKGKTLVKKGDVLESALLDQIPEKYWGELVTGDDKVDPRVRQVVESYNEQKELIKLLFGEKIARLKKGDELPPGVIKMVKVYVAIKRKMPWATRWPAATGTRASSPGSCPWRTCRTSRTGPRWTWSSTPWACPAG